MPRSGFDLDMIILDHGVREKFLSRLPERGLGAGAVVAVKLDIEHLALAHAGDAADAQRLQRALDGLALRIEDARLERHGDARLHVGPNGAIAARARLSSAASLTPSPAPARFRAAARSRP